MKKIFTLLAAVCLSTSIFAQYQGDQKGYGKGNDVAYNDRYKKDDGRFNDHDNFGKRGIEMKVAAINRDYDQRIERVRSNWFMNRFKKERIINNLEDQRRTEIRMVYAKFNDKNDHYANHDSNHHW